MTDGSVGTVNNKNMRYMKISDEGLELIKKYESLKLQAYVCPAGKWTIGYGHTQGVKKGQVITARQAEDFLHADIAPIERLLNNMHINFRQGQFDALCSFIFNVGVGNFGTSTLKKRIVSGASDEEIISALKMWNKATVNGKKVTLSGLVKRRAEEAASWLQ